MDLNETVISSLKKELPGRKSLGEYIFERLKQSIIKEEISPGKRIIESRLADVLGISRTPVREAIHKLDRAGFLTRLPRGGFSVVKMTREDIEETFGIRSILESYAARQAAIKHENDDLKPLEDILKQYRSCLNRGEMDALPRINTEFHDMLYALSRSPKLIRMIGDLKDQIYRFRKILLSEKGMARVSDEEHRKMLRAIKMREADRVERLVREHILRGQRMVFEKLKYGTGVF